MVAGKAVADYVDRKLKTYNSNIPGNNEKLANLRNGLGKHPGENAAAWSEVLDGIPTEFLSLDGEPTRAEWAIYTALTLYAFHQQGKTQSVNHYGVGLGKAVKQLRKEDSVTDHKRVMRRFSRVIEADDIYSLAVNMRSLVGMMRQDDITLDYTKLAKDLFYFQIEDKKPSIQFRWGQEYYYNNKKEKS